MCSWSDTSLDNGPKKSNYRVRFRHGVYPHADSQATRADIKKYDYFFGGGQVWVGTPGKVDFVDESAQVAEGFASIGEYDPSPSSSRKTSRPLSRSTIIERIPQATRRSPRMSELSIRSSRITLLDQTSVPAAGGTTLTRPWQVTSNPHRYTSSGPGSVSSLDGSLPSSWRDDVHSPLAWNVPTECARVMWPLEDPIEAHLFRFWVEKAAAWWDITSPHSIFKEVVPQLALGNSMLLNAIFMISAQHIQRFDPYFPARPYFYHERILQCLIPYLAEKGKIEDEATLVAAMLLRSFEEMHAGTQGQNHLSTLELFQGPEGWYFDLSSPVVQACSMVHVHFEIYHSLLNRPSLRVDYQNFILPSLESPSSDITWGNRIVWLCARVLQWAERGMGTMGQWYELADLVDEWERERPASFDTFFSRENIDGVRYFPELWLSRPCHADANQHLRICRIALAANQPRLVLGLGRLSMTAIEHREVLKGLKEIIAVARCNMHAGSAPSIAAHTINKFGVLLQEDLDQCKMIEFLDEVNSMGWPTSTAIERLREQWHWNMVGREEQRTNQFAE